MVFMAIDADGKKGGKMKFAIYFFIETQRWVRHLVFWCHWHSARFEHSTVDKGGSEKLLARKSCFV